VGADVVGGVVVLEPDCRWGVSAMLRIALRGAVPLQPPYRNFRMGPVSVAGASRRCVVGRDQSEGDWDGEWEAEVGCGWGG
jgi:hypothetical protein